MKYMGHSLEYVLCPGRFPEAKHRETYLKIYRCWQEVWGVAFKELDGLNKLNSDAFTRQDFIGALFVDGECKGMSLYRYSDAALETMKDDSYFSNWDDLALKKLSSQGEKILVCSYFTIHPSARKELLGFAMRDFLAGLAATVSLHSGVNAMTSAGRKNRGVPKLTYDWGGVPIAIDVLSGHGEDDFVDLAAFFKTQDCFAVREAQEITPLLDELWESKLIIGQQPIEDVKDLSSVPQPLKKAG